MTNYAARRRTAAVVAVCALVVVLAVVWWAVRLFTVGGEEGAGEGGGASAAVSPTSASSQSGGESTSSTTATGSSYQSVLTTTVSDFARQYPDTGIVVIDTAATASAEANAYKQFPSASLYKLFVAYYILREVDAGTLSLDELLSETGTSVSDCLNDMITVSSNECGVALGHLYGWSAIDELLAADGYFGTVLDAESAGNDYQLTTPRDVATLLERLYEGELLSESSTDLFLSLLADQELNYALPTGLADSLTFAHKTGVLDIVSHDVGILSNGSKDVIVVMMTDGWSNAYSESIDEFTEFGQAISDYMEYDGSVSQSG